MPSVLSRRRTDPVPTMLNDEQMLFGPIDIDDNFNPNSFQWDNKPFASDHYFDPAEPDLFSSWINPDFVLPSPVEQQQQQQPFYSPYEYTPFPTYEDLSPAAISPMSLQTPPEWSEPPTFDPPEWVAGLFDQPSPPVHTISPRSRRHSPLSSDRDATQRVRINSTGRRPSITTTNLFQSSSAPSHISHIHTRASSSMASRRAESVSLSEDREATLRVRRRKRSSSSVSAEESDSKPEPPQKSTLRPPKLAPSAWQLYFTDWIQRQQASNTRKLNVAQAAKEAGAEYASLSPEEKEPYKRRSQQMKEAREREHAAYMRTLTPEDIKRENAFRAAQRKAGKSRKSNIKDPNAPKKPLSAYFMFLQRIRSDPYLVKQVFGDETETTKQSVLAAARWRGMTDEERKPFLAQAEQEKMEYEAARRLYEEGTTGYGTSISFSILPGGSPISSYIPIKTESESESDSGYHRSS
ncbi:hypothetical protein D9758_004856 [Tetrapyrgos nigripes]|uniref:HMG box domain-containing protein n=1 Tax=Tetrapyrgos nigripes TaxID=182062 RepID=A0A8H5G6E1_9AGAR|nr:hypothetical protein D9758_004856 [Tetrapyrgos nigripes]